MFVSTLKVQNISDEQERVYVIVLTLVWSLQSVKEVFVLSLAFEFWSCVGWFHVINLLHFDFCNCSCPFFVTCFSIAILCPIPLHAKVLPWRFPTSHLTFISKNEFAQRSEQWPSKYIKG